MSLENIKQEIQNSVELQKAEILKEHQVKIDKLQTILDEEYAEAIRVAKKLIEKEEHEIYLQKIFSCKNDSQRKLLIEKQKLTSDIINLVKNSLEELLGADTYYLFIKNKLLQYTENGDKVLLSPTDLNNLENKLKIDIGHTLHLETSSAIKSGLIIEKEKFDYNFSSTALIEEKSETIQKLLEKVFHG